MMKEGLATPSYWRPLLLWTSGLLLLAVANQVLSLVVDGQGVSAVKVLLQVSGWAGLLLPFCAYAGGVGWYPAHPGGLVKRGLAVTALSYLLLAYGAPIARFHDMRRSGTDVSASFPSGPRTPGGLLVLRSRVQAEPPTVFSFRIDQPLEAPPNWLTYLLHSPAALAVYSLFSILLGYRTAGLTTGLSPPNRRNARWAVGLALSVVFFVVEAGGGEWVRADPSRPGILGAWLPMVLPLGFLGVFEVVFRRVAARSPSSGFDPKPG